MVVIILFENDQKNYRFPFRFSVFLKTSVSFSEKKIVFENDIYSFLSFRKQITIIFENNNL